MSTSMQCIILLACMGICTSATIRTCRCLKTVQSVKFELIVDVRRIGIRPYCSREEVIVQMANNNSWCLDPKVQWTKALLQKWERKKNATGPKKTSTTTTTSTTTSATIAQTS